jgi:hypothetical protein
MLLRVVDIGSGHLAASAIAWGKRNEPPHRGRRKRHMVRRAPARKAVVAILIRA